MGEDKTKSIVFPRAIDLRGNNICFAGNFIKQHETKQYLGCQLDPKLSGEVMVSKVLRKINARIKFLYRQSMYLTLAYKMLLDNALIQPHFNYGNFLWFPLLKKNVKMKSQKAQNNVFALAQIHLRDIIWIHRTLFVCEIYLTSM